jgi:hypothetical protein
MNDGAVKKISSRLSYFISTSDQPVLIFCALNFFLIAVDIQLAHQISNVRYDIASTAPMMSAVAGLVVVIASAFAGRFPRLSVNLNRMAASLGIILGLSGGWFHIAKFLELKTVSSLVYSAPFAAPLILCGIALVVMSASEPSLSEPTRKRFSSLLVSGFFAGNFVLALLDHAQNGFYHPAEWLPVAVSAFGAAVWLGSAIADHPLLGRLIIFAGVVSGLVGLLGLWFHVAPLLPLGSMSDAVLQRVPLTAPMLMLDAWILGELIRSRFKTPMAS